MTKKTVKTVKPTKVPGIPQPPNDTSPGMRRYLEALSEAVEIRLGRRGDQRDRAITLRELVDSGLAVELGKTPYDPDRGNQTFTSYETAAETAVEEPDPPTGFTAAGGYELISLFWDYPTYRGHSLTEVWRHTSDVIGDAQLIGVTGGTSYVDSVGESASFYYWVRHVNVRGNQGDFNSANGTLAETSPNVSLLLNELADSISESELTDALTGRIDLVDGAASLPGSVANQISCVNASIAATALDLSSEVTARGVAISCVNASISATALDLSSEVTARGVAISCTAAALNASITALSNVAAYDNAAQYDIGDLVVSDSTIYRAITQTTGNAPPNSNYWVSRGSYTSIVDFVEVSASETTNVLSSLRSDYFTEACARSAITAATLNLASETFVTNNLLHYTNTATLQQVYFTESCARSAITAATLNLASETFVTNNLLHYTNTATLQQTYFTISCGTAAISAAVTNLASETFVTNNLLHYTNTATLQQAYFTITCATAAISAATRDLVSTAHLEGHYTNTASLSENYYTRTDADSAIAAYTNELVAEFSGFDPHTVWNFDDNTTQSWVAAAGGTITASNTVIIHGSTNTNPQIRIIGLQIPGEQNTIVRIRVKRNAGSNWDGKLKYATTAATSNHGFNNSYYARVANDPTSTGAYVLIDWDMTSLVAGGTDWVDNEIRGLLIELGASTSDEFEIDWIAVGSRGPSNTRAELRENYFTVTCATAAISAATRNLASETFVTNNLLHYTNTATLQQAYFTESCARSAITAATLNLASETFVTNALGDYTTTSDLELEYLTRTCLTGAIASAGLALSTTINDTTVTIEDINTSIDGVTAQNFIKIDNAGHISGYGLYSTNADGIPTAEFGVRADQFWIAPAAIASNTAPTTNLFPGKVWVDTSGSEDVTKYYTGNAWSTTPQALPFVVQTSPVENDDGDVLIPAGVYIDSAFIKNGSITTAQIRDATIDTANVTGTLTAFNTLTGKLEADRIHIDTTSLDTALNGNGERELILRDGGIFVDNLSVDSVGIVKFSLNNNYIAASNQSFAFSNFTASSPLYEYSYTFINNYISEPRTDTLPTILTLTINNTSSTLTSDLKETNTDYYIDFSAAIIGSAANNSSTSASALVLSVKQRDRGSTGSYSDYQQFGSHQIKNGALPLIPIDGMVKVTLSNTKDYQINLHGYIKGIDTSSGGERGFASRRIRLFRIAKASA